VDYGTAASEFLCRGGLPSQAMLLEAARTSTPPEASVRHRRVRNFLEARAKRTDRRNALYKPAPRIVVSSEHTQLGSIL
jgi:hypothetical protein